MSKFYRILSLVLVVCMVFTMLPAVSALAVVEKETTEANVSADAAGDVAGSEPTSYEVNRALGESFPEQAGSELNLQQVTATKVDAPDVDLKAAASESEIAAEKIDTVTYAEDELVRVIVVLKSKSLLAQGYTVEQISGNVGNVTNAVKTMKTQQDSVIAQINDVVMSLDVDGIDTAVTARYNYNVTVSGVSVEVPYGALEGIRELDSVDYAFVAPTYSLPENETVSSSGTIDTNTYATSETFGSAETWELGYTGAGMRIAIIDTGIDTDHPSFVDAPADPSLTKDELSVILPQLNASQLYSGLTADDVYVSEKIPYGFNYVDESLDVTHDNDEQGDHGSHVAGIAAANKIESTDVVGVAPDAQLIIMKVFGRNGGAYFDDIMAALEDCFRLDVDAVNMSLGSPAGFTDAESDAYVANLFSQIEDTDMVVSISAGNSYSAAYGNMWGTNVNFAWDPDNGVVSSPATYPGATMVASVENVSYRTNYITLGDREIIYYDALYTFPSVMAADGPTEYEYVIVPGTGDTSDYEGLDVTGKIAVVQRGSLDFVAKQTNAANAGAVACIVYDNVYSSDLIYMQDSGTVPSIFISREDGEALAAAVDAETGVGTLTVMGTDAVATAPSSTAGQMNDFSSWGVTPDLELAPDVTAPGGNIYSCYTDGEYGMMSGTSMAAPHITGMSAVVIQYLDENYELTDAQTHTVAEALIMSTAEPITESTGFLYSPRKQGSGVANVYSAVTSPAYLTVNGSTPKVSFGDDDKKTGDYTFTFELNNMSDEAQTYALDTTVLTDWVDATYGAYGIYFMGETSYELSAQVKYSYIEDYNTFELFDLNGDGVFDELDVQYALDAANGVVDAVIPDLNGDEVFDTADAQYLLEMLRALPADGATDIITVPAGEDVIVTVNIKLSEYAKKYMDTYYENGIYVDGFVRFYGMSEDAVDLSLPFVGFYGDWSAADVFDNGWYYDDDAVPNRYYNVYFTDFGGSYWNLGLNPYLNEDYDESHNVLSPNGDGYQDSINEIYLGMMRNAKAVDFTWTDEDDNVLYSSRADYVRKSYYLSAYGLCYPFIYSDYLTDIYDYSDLSDGDVVTMTVSGYLDDGDMLADQVLTAPIVIDTTAPELTGCELIYDEETDTRTLRLTVSDNYDIAALIPLTLAGDPYEYIAVNTKTEGAKGETAVIDIDVSGYDASFLVAVCDYGCNESYYQITFSGEYNIDFNKFYAYRQYCVVPYGSNYYTTTGYNGWHSFATPDSLLMHTSTYDFGETAVSAAEYVDGYVIGVDENGTIFANKVGYWSDRVEIGTLEFEGVVYSALDMAFDQTTDTLYILTDELSTGKGGHLVKMDYLTGELTDLGIVRASTKTGVWANYSQPLTLACDNDGVLYTVNYSEYSDYGSYYESGVLFTISIDNDEETGETTITTTKIGDTGYKPKNPQSMTVDHATDTLYWAAYQGYTGYSALYEVNKETGELTEVTDSSGNVVNMEYNSELTALFKPCISEDLIPDDAELVEITLSESSLTMAAGGQSQLTSLPKPYYAEIEGVEWTSSNEAVATVDENGVVTAVAEGTAIITAAVGDISATCEVTVVELNASLYVYDLGNSYEWLSFEANAPQAATAMESAMQPVGVYDTFLAATYTVDDTVYAYDSSNGFYKLDADTLQGVRLASNSSTGGTVLALTFSPADGFLYALVQGGDYWESTYSIAKVNPYNGDTEILYTFGDDYYPMNLAVDPDGTFYSVIDLYDDRDAYTVLLSFTLSEDGDLTNAKETELLDFEAGYGSYNSLVYSDENDGLFWADYYGRLLWIDPESGATVTLGTIDSTDVYPMNMCLIEVPKEDPKVNFADPTGVTMADSFLLVEDSSVATNVQVEPWNAKVTLTYTVADESVATVDTNGVITGVGAGETTLTVKYSESENPLTATITVRKSAGTLYGNVVTDFSYGGNIWISFTDSDPVTTETLGYDEDDTFAPYAGAYYDGCVYAYGQDNTGDYDWKFYLLKIDLSDYTQTMIAQVHETLMDMAFDYRTGTMYAVGYDEWGTPILAQVDLETGEVYTVGETATLMTGVAATADGELYAVSSNGYLYKLDKTSGESEKVGYTGVPSANYSQSLYYEPFSGNTYWAQVAGDYTNGLYLVDLETGAACNLGSIGPGVQLAALYSENEVKNSPDVPETVEPSGVSLTAKDTTYVDGTLALEASVLPFSVADVNAVLTWTSSDPGVATVDQNGVVTGVSAGTATITATTVNGKSASCTVTITAESRRFYAYDETNAQWVSFSADDETTELTVERKDAEDEAKILASAYVDGKLYSYTEDGKFWSVDPDTFERTYIGDGAVGLTANATYYDWWDGMVTVEVDLKPVDLSYDESTGKLYGVFRGFDSDYWVYESEICEIDTTDGSVTVLYSSDAQLAGNLLVKNSRAFFVDTYMNGIITYVDLDSEDPVAVQQALLVDYYNGEYYNGRSLIEDPLTGTVYMFRDKPDDGGETTLYKVSMSDGFVEQVTDSLGIVANSLFIK